VARETGISTDSERVKIRLTVQAQANGIAFDAEGACLDHPWC
jgi:hypothetical protein